MKERTLFSRGRASRGRAFAGRTRRSHGSWVAVAVAALSFGAAMGEARADGVLLGPGGLAPSERAALVADIQKARSATPAAFAAVADLRARLGELDAAKRGRFAPIGPMLKRIGPDGLLPMLEHVAIDSPPRKGLTDTAWSAWRVGLLEAIGTLRDARSAPVLVAVLDGPETDFGVVRAAAAALGKLGTDAAAAKLVAMAKTAGPKQKAVLAGMGHCRRTVVAQVLAAAIAARPDEGTAEDVVRSLGDVGSAWAWDTPVVSASGERKAVQAIAAKALVEAFVAYGGKVRKTASNALMVVDDPSTPALAQAAKQGASAEVRAALDELVQRFANNPTR